MRGGSGALGLNMAAVRRGRNLLAGSEIRIALLLAAQRQRPGSLRRRLSYNHHKVPPTTSTGSMSVAAASNGSLERERFPQGSLGMLIMLCSRLVH